MPRKTKTNKFEDALTDLERIGAQSAKAQAIAATGDPLRTAEEARQVLEAWRTSGAEQIFSTDAEYAKYCKTAGHTLTVQIFQGMHKTLEHLNTMLTGDVSETTAKEFATIFGELGRQLVAMRKLDDRTEQPATEQDLDAELNELQKRLQPNVSGSGTA